VNIALKEGDVRSWERCPYTARLLQQLVVLIQPEEIVAQVHHDVFGRGQHLIADVRRLPILKLVHEAQYLSFSRRIRDLFVSASHGQAGAGKRKVVRLNGRVHGTERIGDRLGASA